MTHFKKEVALLMTVLALAVVGTANAQQVLVTENIAESTTWTNDKTYNLQDQIFVLPGATLTIQPGTVIASTPSVDGSGSLAVTRGAQIFVNGTAGNPVIMTSTADVETWDDHPDGLAGHPTGKLPNTGTWREAVNEWGNLTIMGNGLISASHFDGNPVFAQDGAAAPNRQNTKIPDGLNKKQMEGLTAEFPGDPKVLYGGNDDNDDSGSISYLSIRYGGRVLGLGNELNGLSLGGIGRETDIHHVEIMNNVDDGIEIWGGTVNLKYVNIWNIGDDSFDIDQGWRGKAQFGLIVQGYSVDASQGSGVGDNVFEHDGAEDSDAQPVTTGVIYNFTAIGQPVDGDGGTTWRDNARIQYRNCIWMNLGDQLVKFDNDDGDGANGYGFNGTLSWADTWLTDAGTHSTVNAAPGAVPGDFNHPDTLYQAQTTGKLAEISDSVFFDNAAGAYAESDARGVTIGGDDNPALHNVVADVSPIQSITRAAPVTRGGKIMSRVVSLNPLPANDALDAFNTAPSDGFFTPADYRGAFGPVASQNWLAGWSAADAFGFLEIPEQGTEVLVTEDIAESETWTADNVYNLQEQIFVLPGATLTIEAGTVIASTPSDNGSGSLAVTPGAQIFVNGTADDPVIMTSTEDVATWQEDLSHPTGGDPKSGTWREAVNEWGNLTILGRGLISGSHFDGEPVSIRQDDDGVPGGSVTERQNTKIPDGLNKRQMEGLTAAFDGDPKVLYGGNDDNDDSGSISYLSIRYGGRVLGLGNELNGLSLGGIGRETDIHHVEIMNNVDDGIEIWGGTVNLKYVNIWNIGDDSFDIDQGWRGKAQFGLIVQGFSADADQGSGVGDNVFEHDGAEDSDAQPVTTAAIYNFTAIGQPIDGDGGTAWRDNARIQYRNCIWMDLGDQLVRFDNDDGDGANGYGFNGTLSWEQTWQTRAGQHSVINFDPDAVTGDFNHPDTLYQAQVDNDGFLAEITDSVFYRNLAADAYTEADARGVTIAGDDNPDKNNVVADTMPIQAITRDDVKVRGGKQMLRVTNLNPLPAGDAVLSADSAPDDGFFTPAQYRGGFAPAENWLLGWTAADAFGMVQSPVSGEVQVSDDIAVSTVWTSNNVYNLQNQVNVLPGATLIIQPGTVVASTPTEDGSGSLAVTRGAKIFVNGTAEEPVIMTSTADVATWDPDPSHPTGGDPKSGVWREAINEWGNLTILGNGVISASHFDGEPVFAQDGGAAPNRQNTKIPDGLNKKQMEGLTAAFPGDPKVLYGGADDNDDSGSISYLSIRYGGRVLGLGNELNGLSLGGIGRETDIHHVEIMNNVDDGIEIWGGTVNLKYVNIWNIGDDSFDIDQGWRGKAQFGLIVQGFSADADQGSGVGDNVFEHDGAEDSDAQPITTGVIYNFTAVGQPLDGDGGTTWRDNARIQYRNCIWMNLGDQLVKFDNDDGDGANGYGFSGTLSWADTWNTPAGFAPPVNAAPGAVPGDFNHPDTLYQAQRDGFLAEITDSVFFDNAPGAYTESDARGVTVAGGSNPAKNNIVAVASPIKKIERAGLEIKGGKQMLRVTGINPLPANDALESAGTAPDDGFFTPANYRGAFAPDSSSPFFTAVESESNWLLGWTAADAFGFIITPPPPDPASVPSEQWQLYE